MWCNMPAHNADVAAVFEEMADLLEIEGSNPFRIRAYRNAARTLRDLPREVGMMLDEGEDLTEMPGIGEDLAAKIKEVVQTGTAAALEEHRKKVPKTLTDLLRIPGIGPKRAKALYHDLNIRTLDQLQKAAQDGLVRSLQGFGEKTERYILNQLKERAGEEKRFQLAVATQYAGALVTYLRESPGVKQVVVAGSYRRAKDTIGDLDILVTAASGSLVMDRFVSYPEVEEILAQGTTKASVRLACKLQVDVRVVPEDSYGAALQYFTGSKAHNVTLRQLAQQRGLKLNEYGLFKGRRRSAGVSEQEVYQALGLRFIEPELREDRGEIEAAQRRRLPSLVELDDLRGDLHCHSRASDGRDTIEALARAAQQRGYEYISINDHSQHVTVAHGLDRRRLMRQVREIDRLNGKLRGIAVLKSVEVDILEDGSLDLPDEVLKELDFTVCAIHYGFRRSRAQQTRRLLRAMDNRYFSILAHPTGRLINAREPYEIDLERVLEAARERGIVMELNAHPDRLDLDDRGCRLAKEIGVKVAIATDAHRVEGLDLMRYGVDQARRGWLEPGDVINTRPLAGLRRLLRRA